MTVFTRVWSDDVLVDEWAPALRVAHFLIEEADPENLCLERTPDGDRLKIRVANGWADYAVTYEDARLAFVDCCFVMGEVTPR